MGICPCKRRVDLIPELERLDTRPIKNNRALIIFILGGPGVGKSTLCEKLASKYGFFLISVSNILREEIVSGSETGMHFKKMMQQGLNVPAEIVVHLVVRKMLTQPNAYGYLVIGFPREKKQAVLFNKQVRQPTLVINLFARRLILQDRMAIRAASVARFDDTPEAICNRVKMYYTKISGAMAPNKTVTKIIDAETTADEVFREACKLVNEVLKKVSENETT